MTRSSNSGTTLLLLATMLLGLFCFVPTSRAITKGTNVLDLLTDMEAGNPGDLVTSNLMFNASHTNGNIGFWLVSTNAILTLTNLNNTAQRGPVIINSIPYTGSGNTKSFSCDLKQNLTRQYATFNLATGKTKLSVGFSFKFKYGGVNTGDLYDLFALEGGGGSEFQVLSVESRSGNTSRIGLETSLCPSGSGYIHIEDDTYYWVTMQWNKNGSANMNMYDMTTWQLYFTTNCTLANFNCDTIYVGRYDAHDGNHPNGLVSYDNLMVDLSGNNYPLLPVGATVTATSSSFVDVSNAVLYTSPAGNNGIYDTVSIPSSSNLWTKTLTITNTCLIKGAGTNSSQTVIRTSVTGQTTGLDLKSDFIKLRDFQFRGAPGVASDGWGIVFNSNNCSCSNIYMQDFLSCVIANVPYGVMYNCTFRNASRIPGRFFGTGDGQANWNAFTPFNGTTDWAKTNFFVVEDSVCQIDSAMDGSITGQPAVTSQQGALWVVRRCRFNYNIAYSLQPMFDSHGETDPGPLRGNIAIQVYSNSVNWTSGSFDKFVDLRGGCALVYSNGGSRNERGQCLDA
jgi:hypothetical protein